MTDTKHVKVEFRKIAYSKCGEEQQSTQKIGQVRSEIMKIIQKEADENMFSGYRKVNYADQKMKETYRKINKMLGGN